MHFLLVVGGRDECGRAVKTVELVAMDPDTRPVPEDHKYGFFF